MIHLPPPLLHPGVSVYGCVCRQAPTGQRPSASQRWPQVNCLLSFAAPPCRTSVHMHNRAAQVSAHAQPCSASVCTCTTVQRKCLHMHNRAAQVSAHAQPRSASVCTCTTAQHKCLHMHNRAAQVSAHAQKRSTSVCTCTTAQHKCLHMHNRAAQVSAHAQPRSTSVCTCTTAQHKCLHMHNRAAQVSVHAQPRSTSVCTCTTVQRKCLHMQVAQLGSYLHKLKLDIQSCILVPSVVEGNNCCTLITSLQQWSGSCWRSSSVVGLNQNGSIQWLALAVVSTTWPLPGQRAKLFSQTVKPLHLY